MTECDTFRADGLTRLGAQGRELGGVGGGHVRYEAHLPREECVARLAPRREGLPPRRLLSEARRGQKGYGVRRCVRRLNEG